MGVTPTRFPAFHPRSTEDDDLRWSFFVKHYANEEQQRSDGKYDEQHQSSLPSMDARWLYGAQRHDYCLSSIVTGDKLAEITGEIRLGRATNAPVFLGAWNNADRATEDPDRNPGRRSV